MGPTSTRRRAADRVFATHGIDIVNRPVSNRIGTHLIEA
jgi:hypothetical protein